MLQKGTNQVYNHHNDITEMSNELQSRNPRTETGLSHNDPGQENFRNLGMGQKKQLKPRTGLGQD